MYKEKLRELLKTNDQVKEQMEKLEEDEYYFNWLRESIYLFTNQTTFDYNSNEFCLYNLDFNCNLLQERFLRMYCENKNINYSMHKDWFWIQYKWVIKIDNTKDFNNQSEEVYQKIYEALISL